MNIDKLIFDVKERMAAMSDDRRLDKRYILHLIGVARSDYLRQLLSKRPGYNTISLEQNFELSITSVDRSMFTGLSLNCYVMKGSPTVPKLFNTSAMTPYYKIRTADRLKNTIEVIDYERVMHLTFEFDAVYAFMDTDESVYFIAKNNHQELKYAVVTGIFEDPMEVDPLLTEYPMPPDSWKYILPYVMEALTNRPSEDPINNSEPDYTAKTSERK